MRCGPKIEVEESAPVSSHHEKLLLSKYNSLIKSGQKLCTSHTSKVMGNIKVNKVSGENIHVQESPVRKASDESVTQ
jgi:cytochrome c